MHIKALQCSAPWQVAEALLLHILHSRPTSSFFLQKQVHIGSVTHTSSMESVHGTIEFLHMSILKSISPGYTVNSWSPSTAVKYNIVSIAPTNLIAHPSTTSSMCSRALLSSICWGTIPEQSILLSSQSSMHASCIDCTCPTHKHIAIPSHNDKHIEIT